MYLQKKHVFSVPQVSHLYKSYITLLFNSTAMFCQNFKEIGQEEREKSAYAYGHKIFIYIDESHPCGGGLEYFHRDPASRRRRQKRKSQI